MVLCDGGREDADPYRLGKDTYVAFRVGRCNRRPYRVRLTGTGTGYRLGYQVLYVSPICKSY